MFKYFFAIAILFLSETIQAMESLQKIESSTHTPVIFVFKTGERIHIPSHIIHHSNTLQGLLDDLGSEKMSGEILLPEIFSREGFEKFIELAQAQSRDECMREYTIPTCAHTLLALNYLDCPLLLHDVLVELCRKIDGACLLPGYKTVWEELDSILPKEIICMIIEILLTKFQHVQNFFKLKLSLADPTSTKERKTLGILFDPSGRYMRIYQRDGVPLYKTSLLYDTAQNPIKEIARPEGHESGFSPDGQYFYAVLHSDQARSLLLIELASQNKKIIEVPSTPIHCAFSPDGTAVLINEFAYDLQSGSRLTDAAIHAYRNSDLQEEAERGFYLRCFMSGEVMRPMTKSPESLKLMDEVLQICSQLPQEFRRSPQVGIFSCFSSKGSLLFLDWRDSPVPPMKKILQIFKTNNPKNIIDLGTYWDIKKYSVSPDKRIIRLIGKDAIYLIDSTDVDTLRAPRVKKIPVASTEVDISDNNKSLLVRVNDKIVLYWYLESFQEFVPIEIPEHIASHTDSSLFANFDSCYFVLRRKLHRFSEGSIELRHIPIQLLADTCSLRKFIMLINYAKSPTILDQPYYQDLFNSLYADVRTLIEMEEPMQLEVPRSYAPLPSRDVLLRLPLAQLPPFIIYPDPHYLIPHRLAPFLPVDQREERQEEAQEDSSSESSSDESNEGNEPPAKKIRRE